jgi:hypothetical protein
MAETQVGVGYDLSEALVGDMLASEIWARGICVCGHRTSKHEQGPSRMRCHGVPAGRRTHHAKVEDNACACTTPRAVAIVTNARRFQLSWKMAYPSHPFTVAMLMAGERVGRGLDVVETWLVPVPLQCENPEGCLADGALPARVVYAPGTRRTVSVIACRACVPQDSAL